MQLTSQLVSIVHKKGISLSLNLGYRYKLSGISKFNLVTFLGLQSFGIDFRYQRLGLNVHFPITLCNKLEPNTIAFSLLLTGFLGLITYGYEKWRRTTCKARRKLENMNRDRLMQSKKQFVSSIMELNTEELYLKLANESQRRGLIILKALYGKPALVHKEYKKELRVSKHRQTFPYNGDPIKLFEHDKDAVGSLNLESIFSELLDLQIPLQSMVTNSRLSISIETIETIPGIYNPSVDDEMKSHLFLKYYLNEKVYIVYLDEKQRLEIDKDIDVKLMKFDSTFSLMKWFNRAT